MKKFFFALLSAVLFAAPAFASGPWGNGLVPINPLNINGTYQGTIKGKNLTGSMRFASSSSGQIVVTSTNYMPIWSGSAGDMHPTSYIAIITTQVVSASGYANLFVDGYSAPSTLNTAVDVGARTVSGLIEGGSVGSSQTLSNPYFVVATGTGATWTVTNNIYLNGDFSGRFSKNWTANSFSGKGSVTVSKVDIAGFMAAASSSAAASNPAAAAIAAPQMLTVARSIKVEGVKTTDVATPFTPTAAFSMPTITQN